MKISKTHIIKFGKFNIKTTGNILFNSTAYYKSIRINTGRWYTTRQESVDDLINELSKTFHETVRELI